MSKALAQNKKKPCSIFNVNQGKVHGDNEIALMGLTPARKVFVVFIWSKKTQLSNTIIAGQHVLEDTVASTKCMCVCFLHCTSTLGWSLFNGCV